MLHALVPEEQYSAFVERLIRTLDGLQSIGRMLGHASPKKRKKKTGNAAAR